MKLSKIATEDPILTAYALGELDAAEAARVAAAISHNAAALRIVNEIRSTAGELQAALKDEPVLNHRSTPLVEPKSATIIHFPYYAVGAAAAACLAAVFAVRLSHPSSSRVLVSPAPVAAKVLVPTDAEVAATNRLAKSIPDGFSDLKPAPFRDSGYRLGKSIASDSTASGDTASTSKIAPAPANSPSTSGLASDETPVRDETMHQILSLKLSPQLPVVDVANKVTIPLVNPRAVAFSNQDVKFTGLPDFRTMLKEFPRGSTSEEVLSWSTQDLEKKDQAEHRNDFIDLVKKPKNATVE